MRSMYNFKYMYKVYWKPPNHISLQLRACFYSKSELEEYLQHPLCPPIGWEIIVDNPNGNTIRRYRIGTAKFADIAQVIEETVKLFNRRK